MVPMDWNRACFVIDVHIFILLVIWLVLDRSNIYFSDIWAFVRSIWHVWKR